MSGFIDNFLTKVSFKLGKISNSEVFNFIFVGNDINDNLLYHFDFSNHSEQLLRAEDNLFHPADVIVIVGAINLNQVEKVKNIYEELKSKSKHIVHLHGSLDKKILAKSYFVVENLSNHLNVDLEYSTFPFSLEEILSEISKLKVGTNEA